MIQHNRETWSMRNSLTPVPEHYGERRGKKEKKSEMKRNGPEG
jgi:hypothetical protein